MNHPRCCMKLMNIIAASAIARDPEALEAALREVDAMFQALAARPLIFAEPPIYTGFRT